MSEDAEIAQIRRAYWNLAKKYHPDLNGGDRSFANQFKSISEAYEILTAEKNHGRYNLAKDEVLIKDRRPFSDEESYWDSRKKDSATSYRRPVKGISYHFWTKVVPPVTV